MAEYAHPEVLVSTQWVADHGGDANVRIVESDEDVLLYTQGHVPGAVKIDWHTDLQDSLVRDFVGKERFAELCRTKGIANDTTVVFYGDKNNWWACYAFWVFKLYGHEKCLIMNGGRKSWEADGREWSRDPEPTYPATEYHAQEPDLTIRAFQPEVLKHTLAGKPLVDVRSPGEYTGEMLHMPDYPQEGALRGAIFPARSAFPGRKRRRTMARSKPRKNWRSCIARRTAYRAAGEPSRIAASASAAAIRGSCSSICSALTT